MDISMKVYEMMRLRTLTIYELADKSGISANTIYNILGNKIPNITLPTIKKLAKALGCTPGWLLKE